ncbi:MAG: MFS transporter [Bacillota bacterium]
MNLTLTHDRLLVIDYQGEAMARAVGAEKWPAAPGSPRPRPHGALGTASFTVAHLINDTYPNLYPVLLPELMPVLHFGTAAAGLISTVTSLTTQFLQPFMGMAADRLGGRRFVVGGLTLGSIVTALALGFAPSYALLLLLLLIAGLGNSAFHPHASSIVGEATVGRKGLGMSFFMIGGNFGRAVAPVMASVAFLLGGRHGLLVVAIPGLIMALVMAQVLNPPPPPHPRQAQVFTASFRRGLSAAGGLLTLVGLRSMATLATLTLVPIWWKASGRPITEAAGLLSLLFIAGSVGNVAGGYLSDHIGSKPVLIGSAVLSSLFMSLFLLFRNPLLDIVVFALLGASLYSTGSVVMVFSQALFPENRGMASGLTLGIGNTLGSLGVGIIGIIADRTTPATGLWAVAGAVLLSIPFVIRLREHEVTPPAPAPGPTPAGR